MPVRHPGDHRPERHRGHSNDAHGKSRVRVRLRDAPRLLAAVPYLLGAACSEPSLVVLGVRQRHIVAASRIPLPAADFPPNGLARMWPAFTRSLVAKDVKAVSIMAYADRSWIAPLQEFAAAAPLAVLDLLRVYEGRWWTLDCPDPGTCRHPSCSSLGARLRHQVDTATRITRGALPDAGTEEVSALLRPGPPALLRAVSDQLAATQPGSPEHLFTTVVQAHKARRLGSHRLPPEEAAVVLRAVTNQAVHDACLVWTDNAARALWRDLVHAAPPGWVAPAATLLALIAYRRGDQRAAALAVEHALKDAPGYDLAHTVKLLLHHHVPPAVVSTLTPEAVLADLLGPTDPTRRANHAPTS